MNITRVRHIQDADINDIKDQKFIENLILTLGLNTEILDEQPDIVKNNTGGLLIWQYPNQFSKYLYFLSTVMKDKKIDSYMEIGCRWGGTFVLTVEYIKRFFPIHKAVGIDIFESPLKHYTQVNENCEFLQMNSTSDDFSRYMHNNFFDMIFIDGDHSYEGVKNDFNMTKNHGNIFVFHDMVSDACPGVVQFWNELLKDDSFTFYEFTDQYEDVTARTGRKYLGIGVAVRKNFIQ